ncbi:MAG: AAA family ATPase [Candidatus Diapherotrites archaeon]|jgi:circadian clock protein KaiC|nr:AAA family ATPase [Candidatus Diapherotrites archaeon]MBT4596569.1 AAA family ATPase [Candidatus Diapherotrites archaeon]
MVEEIIRTKTGIQDLDKALNGGIPQGNIVLVSGGAGTGKSTLCLQFAVNGASTFGEKALYISTEQNKTELYKQANGFGWDISSLELKNLLKTVYFDITEGNLFLEKLETLITEFKPQRLIIDSLITLTDSLTVAGISNDEGFSMVRVAETVSPIPRTEKIISKSVLYHLFKVLRKYQITTILTTELFEGTELLSSDGVSEFIADGVVLLHFLGVGGMESRSLQIRKMRYTAHDEEVMQYSLGKSGIEFSTSEELNL